MKLLHHWEEVLLRDYNKGVSLYIEHGGTDMVSELQRHIGKATTYMQEDLLYQCLRDHSVEVSEPANNPEPPGARHLTPGTPSPAPDTSSAPSVPLRDTPPAIQHLLDKAKSLMKVRADAHSKMKVAATDSERYTYAQTIIEDCTPQIDELYEKIDHWRATGEIPQEGIMVDAIRKAVGWTKQLKSARTQVGKIKKKLKTVVSEQERVELQQRLAKHEANIEELVNKLDV